MFTESVQLVEEFHTAFLLPVGKVPGLPDQTCLLLRLQLLQEELAELAESFHNGNLIETLDALTDSQYVLDGTYVVCGLQEQKAKESCSALEYGEVTRSYLGQPTTYQRLQKVGKLQKALGKLAHAFALGSVDGALVALDQYQYALNSTYLACGMERVKEAAFREVHSSNMSKLDENGKPILDAAGRVQKPPHYRKPDLERVLLLGERMVKNA